jgi:hypothetical protein|tara:strand:- start:9488 stop:9799 length:312 start_codon:yes stop_codon:yes gene_type:complete
MNNKNQSDLAKAYFNLGVEKRRAMKEVSSQLTKEMNEFLTTTNNKNNNLHNSIFWGYLEIDFVIPCNTDIREHTNPASNVIRGIQKVTRSNTNHQNNREGSSF